MSRVDYQRFEPAFPEDYAASLLELCEGFGAYGMYDEEGIEEDIGEGLSQRHDAVLHFLRTGGRGERTDSIQTLVARTNYFREEYAYDGKLTPGIEPFLHYEGFFEGARRVHRRAVVEPSIVYANLLVPGQELALHTDVPEFRGMNRRRDPQWLLVAMHHSGLFERWRMPIATAVAWFGAPRGGEFVFYPDGPWERSVALAVRHNTAILLDTDTVFHGIDPVRAEGRALPDLRPGMRLVPAGGGRWRVEADEGVVAEYDFSELRFSISWKAYCYRDAEEQRAVHEHTDDLSREQALDTLARDLRRRGRIDSLPGETELALTLIDEYIRFPTAPGPGRADPA